MPDNNGQLTLFNLDDDPLQTHLPTPKSAVPAVKVGSNTEAWANITYWLEIHIALVTSPNIIDQVRLREHAEGLGLAGRLVAQLPDAARWQAQTVIDKARKAVERRVGCGGLP